MKFRPLHDRVVVRRIEEDKKTAGGIIIPDTVQEKPMQGEVIAVGPGVRPDRRLKFRSRLRRFGDFLSRPLYLPAFRPLFASDFHWDTPYGLKPGRRNRTG